MKKTEVFFRVDGSSQIGLGHLVRCMALAHMIKDRFQIIFVCQHIPEQTIDEIAESQFLLHHIGHNSELFEYIGDKDMVVLDGYNFDLEYQKSIKSIGSKLIYIDDLHDKEFVADLIINHTPAIISQNYRAQEYTQFALGLDYVLLRPLFLKQANKNHKNKNVENVFICFGGSDTKNLTLDVLEVVFKCRYFKKITVVTGASYVFEASIKVLLKEHTSVEYYHAIGEAEILKLMIEADLAIVPASGILFEAMAAGCKIISGYYADNQKILYEKLKSVDAFINAGNFKKEDIESAIAESVKAEKPALKLINGQSGKNILRSFYSILTSLRKAEYTDCERIFYWANDPTVRVNAFNSNVIEFEDHKTWFASKLKDDNCHIFIITLQDIDIGQIRFDIVNRMAAISYLIDKDYRGLGLGSVIVKKGIDIMRKENKVHTLMALVKPLNEASIKVFQYLGFQQSIIKHQDYDNVYSFSLEL